jgi:hypothetical protein
MKRIIVSLFIMSFVFSMLNAQNIDLSMPENTWNSLIEAMQTGKSELVRNICTPEGYISLTEVISPYQEDEDPFSATFMRRGELWSSYDISIVFISNTYAKFSAANQNHAYIFKSTSEGWKFHQWIMDE